jgi:hypothetical protein
MQQRISKKIIKSKKSSKTIIDKIKENKKLTDNEFSLVIDYIRTYDELEIVLVDDMIDLYDTNENLKEENEDLELANKILYNALAKICVQNNDFKKYEIEIDNIKYDVYIDTDSSQIKISIDENKNILQ